MADPIQERWFSIEMRLPEKLRVEPVDLNFSREGLVVHRVFRASSPRLSPVDVQLLNTSDITPILWVKIYFMLTIVNTMVSAYV